MLIDELEAAALQLDLSGRARLAHRLIESLDELSPEEHLRLWAEEAERRADEMDAGTAEGIPAEDVFREMEALLRDRHV
jgi:hypothetical protein